VVRERKQMYFETLHLFHFRAAGWRRNHVFTHSEGWNARRIYTPSIEERMAASGEVNAARGALMHGFAARSADISLAKNTGPIYVLTTTG